MPIVQFSRVSKSFSGTRAVDAVSLGIEPGEFFSLLGPSGCGKTTMLRLLAGLDTADPDGGALLISGERVEARPPWERRLGMVFQSLALFPHLNVERNVAFGLERHRVPRAEIPARVTRALETVRLDPGRYRSRDPSGLSGGERQRVALARALVLEPELLLLDEPLAALDLKLRKEMQLELKALNRSLGITFVFVTHDQDEALTMSDRIAVMDRGRIVQVGTPAEVYEHPRTAFVAGFIGESNRFAGRVAGLRDGLREMVTPEGWRLELPGTPELVEGATVELAVRPEWMTVSSPGEARAPNAISGTVGEVIYQGEMIRIVVAAGERRLVVAVRNEGQLTSPLRWRSGDAVVAGWSPAAGRVLDPA